MPAHLVDQPLTKEKFSGLMQDHPEGLLKVVVDLRLGVLAVGMELHADGEQLLLDQGSKQEDLWGANVYPDASSGQRIEFTAMINVRPRQSNRSQEIQDPATRKAVHALIRRLLPAEI